MKKHQRYFPVEKNDKLLANFIAIRNGDDQYLDIVQHGNEHVLCARFADANFFVREDLKHPLEYYREGLKTLVFQTKLGSMLDKSDATILRPGGATITLPAYTQCRALLFIETMNGGRSHLQGVRLFGARLHNVTPESQPFAAEEYTPPNSDQPNYCPTAPPRLSTRWNARSSGRRGRRARPSQQTKPRRWPMRRSESMTHTWPTEQMSGATGNTSRAIWTSRRNHATTNQQHRATARPRNDRIPGYTVLREMPGAIGGIEAEAPALLNSKRQAQAALAYAELNAMMQAPQEGKNAEARKLEVAAALNNDPNVKKLRMEVMQYENELEMNEAEAKTKRREFQAAIALAELHAARINSMYRYQAQQAQQTQHPK